MFPFESKYIEVHGARMHYVEMGEGDPILFLHGNPTSSYLWRHIMPQMQSQGRCIAPDLIGMGKSDKPHIAYRFFDHYRYLLGFIQKLGLRNVTLVLHDWGSGLGFHYARMHEANVKAIAFMEAIVKPWTWAEFDRQYKLVFHLMRMPGIGWFLVQVLNIFLNRLLPMTILRDLTPEEKAMYHEPFPSIRSRKPIRQWPCEVPINGKPRDIYQVVLQFSHWLQQTPIPKLLLHVRPGAVLPPVRVLWCEDNIPNLTSKFIGEGIHFIQEDLPHEIGEALCLWYENLYQRDN